MLQMLGTTIQEEVVMILPLAEGSATLPLTSKSARNSNHSPAQGSTSCQQLEDFNDTESQKSFIK